MQVESDGLVTHLEEKGFARVLSSDWVEILVTMSAICVPSTGNVEERMEVEIRNGLAYILTCWDSFNSLRRVAGELVQSIQSDVSVKEIGISFSAADVPGEHNGQNGLGSKGECHGENTTHVLPSLRARIVKASQEHCDSAGEEKEKETSIPQDVLSMLDDTMFDVGGLMKDPYSFPPAPSARKIKKLTIRNLRGKSDADTSEKRSCKAYSASVSDAAALTIEGYLSSAPSLFPSNKHNGSLSEERLFTFSSGAPDPADSHSNEQQAKWYDDPPKEMIDNHVALPEDLGTKSGRKTIFSLPNGASSRVRRIFRVLSLSSPCPATL